MPDKKNERKDNKEKKEVKITDKQLSVIKEEIDHIRFNMKVKRSPSYTKIFKNIIIGILMLAYMYLLIVGYEFIGFETYFKTITILQYVLVILGLVLIEISYQKTNLLLGSHGLELVLLSLITLILVNLFSKSYIYISKYEVGCIIVITVYFLIKSVLIRYIDYKKEITSKENELNK